MREESKPKSFGMIQYCWLRMISVPATVGNGNMYRVRGVIPPGLPVLYPPKSVYVCGEAGRPRDHRGCGCNVRILGSMRKLV